MENKLRDNVRHLLLTSAKKHFVLEMATGVGKTYLALQKMAQLYKQDCKILIVIPRNVLIQNWIEEFHKWQYDDMLTNVTFVTYVSLPKMAGSWDIVIFDEAHHLSERCRSALIKGFYIDHALLLSATLNREIRYFINHHFNAYKELQWVTVNTKKAIEGDVLPDPSILLFPMELDNFKADYLYTSRKIKQGQKITVVPYSQRWKYKSYKGNLLLRCTQQQYYNELSGLILWYKSKKYNPIMKNMWLHKAGERLKWLAEQKQPMVKQLLDNITKRTIVFCGTIAQTKKLPIPRVTSDIGDVNLIKFNAKQIDKISCVGMVDEGVNLRDCQIGIFDMLNSSEKLQIQRVGRILRHQHPIILIPYFKNTRDEEILKSLLKGYNSEKIKTVLHPELWKI